MYTDFHCDGAIVAAHVPGAGASLALGRFFVPPQYRQIWESVKKPCYEGIGQVIQNHRLAAPGHSG